MEHIGEFDVRNKVFEKAFPRCKRIQSAVQAISGEKLILFDVGGHIGESIQYLRRLFPDASIFSFEPDPNSFSKLKQAADENVRCFNLAFADRSGQLDFFRNKLDHTNSLLPVNIKSKDSIYFENVRQGKEGFDPSRFNQHISVQAQRLDEFCLQNQIPRIDLLKLDVQGAEIPVLTGASTILNSVNTIITEVSFFDYYERSSSFYEIEELLRPHGFYLYAITEISNNPMNGRTDWVEVIYTRNQPHPHAE